MNFFDQLQSKTEAARTYLYAAPIIKRCFVGDVSRKEYVAFLQCAFHHVKHTVPLLMRAGSRFSEELEWMREATAEYIDEELGHQEWILNDIAACGVDKEIIRHSKPNRATEIMVSYAYDTIDRVHPLGFFGMVHVLEGTSISSADQAANSIQKALGLPDAAFSYLRSHGALDIEHVDFFKSLMNRITDPEHQDIIVHAANVFYHLYGDVLRSVSTQSSLMAA